MCNFNDMHMYGIHMDVLLLLGSLKKYKNVG